MRSWLFQGMLAAAVALPALSSVAWAGATDDYGCSNATLKGEYAFGVTDYTPPGLPSGPPQVVAGIKVFDGNGNFTQRDYVGGSSPAEFAPKGQEKGTYTVNSDCTGSMVLNLNVPAGGPIIGILFVISDAGRHIHEVVSAFTPPGATAPSIPINTSADDWKVALEEGH